VISNGCKICGYTHLGLYDCKCGNAGKVSPASEFLPVFNCLIPASAFWHQGQSGTAGHELVQPCPAMQNRQIHISYQSTLRIYHKDFRFFTWNRRCLRIMHITIASFYFRFHPCQTFWNLSRDPVSLKPCHSWHCTYVYRIPSKEYEEPTDL
jgi:hypothetical protein